MKLKQSPWMLGFCVATILTALVASATSQTLGKRKLPNRTTTTVTTLPVTYAKAPFQFAISEGVSTANNHEKGMTYLAPMLNSGPDLPAQPEFQFRVVGVNTGEWVPMGSSKTEFTQQNNAGGKLQFAWDGRAEVLKMKLTYTPGPGGSSVGPANETFAIDMTMLDHEAKTWYFSRTVQFMQTSK